MRAWSCVHRTPCTTDLSGHVRFVHGGEQGVWRLSVQVISALATGRRNPSLGLAVKAPTTQQRKLSCELFLSLKNSFTFALSGGGEGLGL